MTFRLALVFLVLGFIAVLLVMGTVSFVRWLKVAYPQRARPILTAITIGISALGVWLYLETGDRPTFHADDLLTLGEPLVVRIVPSERLQRVASCIVEIHEHLAVIEVEGGTMQARVESNAGSVPPFCPVGAVVQFELSWLPRHTLTHRHS